MAKRKKVKKWDEDLVRLTPIDGHVGSRVRLRRTLLGMSQQVLAGKLGITFQQLQKNEGGKNRIGCSRLVDLSRALDVPIQYFFDEMPAGTAGAAASKPHQVAGGIDEKAELLTKTETLKLVRAYYRIENRRVRKRVYDLAKALAGDQN